MARTERFELRISPEERRHLRDLAERTRRTEADLIRTLVGQLDVSRVDTGLPVAALLEASATERATAAA